MSDQPDSGKQPNDTAVKRDPRRDRLKSALRENLKRRKSQARGRQDTAEAAGPVVTSADRATESGE